MRAEPRARSQPRRALHCAHGPITPSAPTVTGPSPRTEARSPSTARSPTRTSPPQRLPHHPRAVGQDRASPPRRGRGGQERDAAPEPHVGAELDARAARAPRAEARRPAGTGRHHGVGADGSHGGRG